MPPPATRVSWCRRRYANRIVFLVTILLLVNVFAVYKAFFEEKVIRVDSEILKHLEEGTSEKEDEEAKDDDDYYYDADVVIFDKLDPNEVTVDNDMFFFVSNGAEDLSVREACPVESAARLHKGRKVFVIFMTSNITDILLSNSLSLLISFENVHLRYINPIDFIKPNKAATSWLLETDFHKLPDADIFLTQVLTYLFLHRFGGSVLTFDTILVKSITPLGQFVTRCDEEVVESHPLTLDSRHPILAELLESALAAFNPEDERATGGRLIGKKVKQMCKVDYLKELRFKECPEAKVKVVQPHVFCPVEEEKHWMLLDSNRATLVLRRMEEAAQGEEVRGLKLWSRHNSDFDTWGSSNRTTAIFEVAAMACPLMMQALGPNGIL